MFKEDATPVQQWGRTLTALTFAIVGFNVDHWLGGWNFAFWFGLISLVWAFVWVYKSRWS